MKLKADIYQPTSVSHGGVLLSRETGAVVAQLMIGLIHQDALTERERIAARVAEAFNRQPVHERRTSTEALGQATLILRPCDSGRDGQWFIRYDTGCELWVPDSLIDALDIDVSLNAE